MTGGPAGLLALAAALLLWPSSGAVRRRRVRALSRARAGPPPAARAPAPAPGPGRRWLLAGAAGLAGAALLGGGPVGVGVGLAVAVAGERLLRRRAGPASGGGDRAAPELPLACDLLAVCLAAGTPVGASLAAVAAVVPGPVGARLAEVGALYRLGAAPQRAWAGTPPPVDALARTLVRAGESGSAVVPALQRLAADLRGADRAATDAAVRRAGVWVLAPLGLCFLPAFLCLGVVPLVLGIAGEVFP
ncbi:type II secretion system F family protein [Modestobacter sp. NPDC049651]|uniref:type II secretion system F family protein n=1 Tax=unclassified Modestobacter TaxID=2643866 RepID=UPI0033E991C0